VIIPSPDGRTITGTWTPDASSTIGSKTGGTILWTRKQFLFVDTSRDDLAISQSRNSSWVNLETAKALSTQCRRPISYASALRW
jgi:hypothetical protein